MLHYFFCNIEEAEEVKNSIKEKAGLTADMIKSN